MGQTIDLREALRAKLLTLCENVYYARAKEPGANNYIVFTLDAVTYDETKTSYDFDVHIVGFGTDTTNVEDLTDSVWDAFNHFYYCADGLGFETIPTARNIVAEENKNTIHRRILFNLKSF